MKQKFDLSLWLQDKSRKVVTRLKKSVQIISIEGKEDIPIIALVEGVAHQYKPNGYHADVVVAHTNQCRDMGDYDLFFADEEEGLTEFERELEMMMVSFSNGNFGSDVIKEMPKQKLYSYAHRLIDIARKEIEKDIEEGAVEFAKSYMEDVNPSFEKVQESEELWKWKMSCLRGINKAYTKGKEDALKDLPKWKKATEYKDLEKHIAILEDSKVLLSNYLEEGDYYIDLEDLKTLLKEE